MSELSAGFYFRVFLWAALLHGVWEYAQVIPLYRCWSRWTTWQRIWILPVATLGDAVATVLLTGATAVLLGLAHVQPLGAEGTALLLGLGLAAGLVFETVARTLDFWRYKDIMPTIRVAGHLLGLAPVLQMMILSALAVWIAGSPP